MRESFALRAISYALVPLQQSGFVEKDTAGNTPGQLAGSGDWVQVAEIFKGGQKIQKLHALEKAKRAGPG